MSYTKLFNSIITSTIWMENNDTRIVWITMLAMADKNGEVQASVPGLARVAGVQTESCREALAKFLSPDPDSRTKDDDGKRIEHIEGGWRLLNHRKYREMCSREEQKASEAKRKADYRAKIKRNGGICDETSENVPDMSQSVTDMSRDVPKSLHIAKEKEKAYSDSYSDSYSYSEEDEYKNKEKKSSASADESDFFSQPEITPKKETVSTEGTAFARWFRDTLPEKTNMPDRWEKSFAQTYEDLVRLDGRNPDEIRRVCQWARTDSFWASNFQSPAKLRKRNKDGIQYYDVFLEKAHQVKRAVQKGTIENIQLKILNGPDKNV